MRNIIIFLALSCLFLGACKKESWLGFFYPNKNDLTIDREIGSFSSLEDCRRAARALIEVNSNADYECGLNCDTAKGKPYICEKTER